MDPFLRSRPLRIAAAVVFVLIAAIGFLPLFGGPGYEHALASGLIVPSAAAIGVALDLSRVAAPAPAPEPSACAGRGILAGLVLGLLSFVIALVHGLFLGLCDLPGDARYYALTALAGSMMGGLWGAVVAEVARGRKRRRLVSVLLSLAAPIACIAISVGRFVASPMIFAFDPFVGYFSGTLYDTVIDAGAALWWYRAGSLASALFVLLGASALVRRDGRRLAFAPRTRGDRPRDARRPRPRRERHHHRLRPRARPLADARVDRRAPGRLPGGRALRSRLPRLAPPRRDRAPPEGLRRAARRRRGRPRRARSRQGDGVLLPRRRREEALHGGGGDVHRQALAARGLPPALLVPASRARARARARRRRELRARAVPGGRFPGRAVAEPGAHRGYGRRGLARRRRAHRRRVGQGDEGDRHPAADEADLLHRLPRPELVEELHDRRGVRPLGARHVRERRPPRVVRRRIDRAADGQELGDLDAAFRVALDSQPLPPQAETFARAKFDRPSIFGRHCPHVIDLLKRDAGRCEENHQIDKALKLYHQVLARDPHDSGAKVRLGVAELRYGEAGKGEVELRGVDADDKAPRTIREHAEEALADGALLAGDYDGAASRYGAIAEGTLDEDFGRNLEVKALVATRPLARDALVPLLLGTPGRPPDAFLGAVNLGVWAAREDDPVADYLVGRNLASHGFYDRGATYLDRALDEAEGSPEMTARLGRELLRMRAVCACATSDVATVAKVRALVDAPGNPFAGSAGGRRETLVRFLARCR